jgi:maltooligosyltrehalose trehalohydrolase
VVALTGRREAYYRDYGGSPQEFVSTAKHGYLYQGQWYSWQKQPRGTSAIGLPPTSFVSFLENHDQVANSASGRRLHQLSSPGRYRAVTALTLLGPATPLLFQGQEFGSTAPFLFFADHGNDLKDKIMEGRREFLSQFASTLDPEVQAALPVPCERATFLRCKLDPGERERHAATTALHRDLLAIRRDDPVIAAAAVAGVDGAVLSVSIFVLRYGGASPASRLLIVNVGPDGDPPIVPEPLIAPPTGCRWVLQWSSEAARYGGSGRAPLEPHAPRHFIGETAVLLRAEPVPDHSRTENDAP